MSYFAYDENDVYVEYEIFQPIQAQSEKTKHYREHITTFNNEIRGWKIVDGTIYFSHEFNGQIEQCWNVMDFVSSIVFVDNPYDGGKQCSINQLFYPRANITRIEFGYKYNQAFVLTRYLTHITFINYPGDSLVLSPRIEYIRFRGSFLCQTFEISKNIVVLGLGTDFNCPFTPNKNMNYLSLSYHFDQDIILGLSKNITHMIGNMYFNKRIDLPKHLVYLSMGYDYKHQILLTPNIKYLSGDHIIRSNCVGEHSNGELCVLYFDKFFDSIPNGLKGVMVARSFNIETIGLNMPNDLKLCKSDHGNNRYTSLKYNSKHVQFRYC